MSAETQTPAIGEPRRAVLRQFGRGAVDHDKHHVAQLRERLLDRAFALPPFDLGGNQFGSVGGHRETVDRDQ